MTRSPAASGNDEAARERARMLKNSRNKRYRDRVRAAARPTPEQVDEAMVLAVMRLQRDGFLPRTTMLQAIRAATEILSGDGHGEVAAAVNARTIELGAASLRPAPAMEGTSETTPLGTPVTPSVRDAGTSSRIVDPTRIGRRRLEAPPTGATF